MQPPVDTIVVLGTGGTIAGTGGDLGYRAGALPIGELVGGLGLAGATLEVESVAEIDSKDFGFGDWRRLIDAVARHLARSEVRALIVTHGTDTLEESAYLLQRLFAPDRPIVLVGAMRPADSRDSDGPQNLADALQLALVPGAQGVMVMFAGRFWHPLEVRKVHSLRRDAFAAGEAGPLGTIELRRVRRFRDWPGGVPLGLETLPRDPVEWPAIEIVTSHAGARAASVEALVAAGADGLVIAATGNGTVHAALVPALERARQAGVALLRATRCLDGGIVDPHPPAEATVTNEPASAGALTPVQARIELMLRIAAARRR